MIDPLGKDSFIHNMEKTESAPSYSSEAIERFYRWMYSDQEGIVQTCAFPVPTENQDKSDMGQGKWIHARTFNEFKEFCETHSNLWRYHVYSGVNTLANEPNRGRGSTENIDTIKKLSFDIELAKQSYKGSTKEDVWWTYQYALAEIKYMSEEYDVWPLVVMSENGIHLHYNVQFPCTDDLMYNRQHLYSKYITQKAMNNKYTSLIESKAPERITFDQDDVSDPARVMKVAGTHGIKSEHGRLCGIIHEPSMNKAGKILPSNIEKQPDQIVKFLDDSQTKSTSNGSTNANIESVDVTPSDLDDELQETLEHRVSSNPKFRSFWNGEAHGYDSRSEMEFAFVIKLLSYGFDEQNIAAIMWASGMSKWDEESDHYRKKTIENAIDYFDGNTVKDSSNGSFSFSDR